MIEGWKAYGTYLIVEIKPEKDQKRKSGFVEKKKKEAEVHIREGKIKSVGDQLKDSGLKNGMEVMITMFDVASPRIKDEKTGKVYGVIPVENIMAVK